MSTNWPSDPSKRRNWFANDGALNNRADANRLPSDTRLAENVEYIGSSAALATAQIHIAALFQNIRQVLDRSRLDIASQLRTTPRVIEYLETGKFTSLPPWGETSRIVSAYTKLVDIDPAPALHVLKTVAQAKPNPAHDLKTAPSQAVFNAAAKAAAPSSNRAAQQPSTQTRSPRPFSATPHPASQQVNWRRGRSGTPVPVGTAETDRLAQGEPDGPVALSKVVGARLSHSVSVLADGLKAKAFPTQLSLAGPKLNRTVLRTGIAILVCLVTVVAALSSSAVVRFIFPYFPDPFATAILSAHNVLSPPRVYERDGMRWIEVADPRLRRTDKLPVPKE